jgi:hypothetical protein
MGGTEGTEGTGGTEGVEGAEGTGGAEVTFYSCTLALFFNILSTTVPANYYFTFSDTYSPIFFSSVMNLSLSYKVPFR